VVAQRSLAQARDDAESPNSIARPLPSERGDSCGRVGWLLFLRLASVDRFVAWPLQRALSAAVNFISARRCRGASEISELAENFNKMAGDIEEYIERLKESAERESRAVRRLDSHAGRGDRRKGVQILGIESQLAAQSAWNISHAPRK